MRWEQFRPILATLACPEVTDEELIEELSFPVYRRVAIMVFVPAVSHHASSVEMVAIDPQRASVAQERDLHHGA